MSDRPGRRWIVGVAALLVVAPLLLLWLLTPSRRAEPLALFLPDRLSAAARLGGLERAWQRHWRGRPESTPETALRDLLEAVGQWPRWVEKNGEVGAQARVRLIPRVLFDTIGEESWLLLGEWGGDAPGQGEMGLVLLLPGEGSLRRSVGPLADLMLDDYGVSTLRADGVTIYVYESKTDRRSLAFCYVGGRIVVSLRQSGAGPLPALIARVKAGEETPGNGGERRLLTAAGGNESLFAVLVPDRFLPQIRHFNAQRGREPSDDTEEAIARWTQRLDGVDRIVLRQAGDSLLDLETTMEWHPGRAPAQHAAAPETAAAADPIEPSGAPPILQTDFDAQTLAALLAANALDWSGEWIDSVVIELVAPGLTAAAREALDDPDAEGERFGVAVYASPVPVMAGVHAWQDFPPLQTASASPAVLWRHSELAGEPTGDASRWYGLQPIDDAAQADPGWESFAAAGYGDPGRPIGFLAIHFGQLAAALERVPATLLKEKARKRLESLRTVAHGLALALGGVTLRLDRDANRYVIQLETMESPREQANRSE
jgi:hypothetical protein